MRNRNCWTLNRPRPRAAIQLMNRERGARKVLMDMGKINPAPLSGSQVLEILFKIGFMADKEKGISLMEEVGAQAKNGAFRS